MSLIGAFINSYFQSLAGKDALKGFENSPLKDSLFESFEKSLGDQLAQEVNPEIAFNLPPEAQDDDLTDSFAAILGQETYLDLSQILENDTDPNGDLLTIDKVTVAVDVEGAKVELSDFGNDGIIDHVKIVLPKDYAQNTFSFTYTITDGHNHYSSATVSLAVSSPENSPPDAEDDDLTTGLNPIVPGEKYYIKDLSLLLGNDKDPDGDSLTIDKVITDVQGAEVSLGDFDNDGAPEIAILLPKDYSENTFEFEYRVNDGHGLTDTATVTLAVSSSALEFINVNNNGSFDAAGKDYIFNFEAGNYTYEIQNFEHGDVLVFPEGVDPTVTNDDFSDGKVIVQWAYSGNTIQVELTGLSEDVDSSLLFISDFQYDEAHGGYTLPEQESGGGGGGELTSQTIDVTGAGEYTASSDVAETFVFQEGTYEYTIQGFDLDHDVLDLPDNPSPTVYNNDLTDGEVTVQWAGNGQLIQVHLIGLSADQDASLLFASDLGSALT